MEIRRRGVVFVKVRRKQVEEDCGRGSGGGKDRKLVVRRESGGNKW